MKRPKEEKLQKIIAGNRDASNIAFYNSGVKVDSQEKLAAYSILL
jgi:hypothetical protein